MNSLLAALAVLSHVRTMARGRSAFALNTLFLVASTAFLVSTAECSHLELKRHVRDTSSPIVEVKPSVAQPTPQNASNPIVTSTAPTTVAASTNASIPKNIPTIKKADDNTTHPVDGKNVTESANTTVKVEKANATDSKPIGTNTTASPVISSSTESVTVKTTASSIAVSNVTEAPKPDAANNTTKNKTEPPSNECVVNSNSTSGCVSNPIDSGYSVTDLDYIPTNVSSNFVVIKATHDYYNSTFVTNKENFEMYWNEITSSKLVKIDSISSHMFAATSVIRLPFDFPFYGHPIEYIKIASGGFIFVGDRPNERYVSTRTEFIAPLMAGFDLSLRNDSFIKHVENDTAITVIWENVTVKDAPIKDSFTFAVTLHKDGTIVFAYKSVPCVIGLLPILLHPVKVGISNAYVTIDVQKLQSKKTIYKYDRVDLKPYPIQSNALIYLTLLPVCGNYNTCSSCVNHNTKFKCTWCPAMMRCSDGIDAFHQEWFGKNCGNTNYTTADQCEGFKAVAIEEENSSAATIANVFIALIIIVSICGWFLYAYRNPHTYSGQLLIKYRPSQWSWRRGEARYTAATIHM